MDMKFEALAVKTLLLMQRQTVPFYSKRINYCWISPKSYKCLFHTFEYLEIVSKLATKVTQVYLSARTVSVS